MIASDLRALSVSVRLGSARGFVRVLGLAFGGALRRNGAVLGEITIFVAHGQVISNDTRDSDDCQTPLKKFIALHRTVSLATRSGTSFVPICVRTVDSPRGARASGFT